MTPATRLVIDPHHARRVKTWSWENAETAEQYGLMVIAFAVRARRLKYKLSQRQLGWRTGVGPSTISRLENGRLPTMKVGTLARIVFVLELGPRFLFPGDPPQTKRELPDPTTARRFG